jgi:hypothetical protein
MLLQRSVIRALAPQNEQNFFPIHLPPFCFPEPASPYTAPFRC